MSWITFKLLLALPIRVVKSRDFLRQSTMGLCVTNQDNPRMTRCWGEDIRSNVIISRWDPIMSSSGIVSSMMAPNRRGSPSITSTGIGFVLMTLEMECVWIKSMPIKHVVALESSRVMVHITRVPICKLTSTVKPFRDGASWVDLIIWLMEPSCIALIAPGPSRFAACNYISLGERQQNVHICHSRSTSCCLVDVVVVHWTTIGAPLYLPPLP